MFRACVLWCVVCAVSCCFAMSATAQSTPKLLVESEAQVFFPALSPDGKWLSWSVVEKKGQTRSLYAGLIGKKLWAKRIAHGVGAVFTPDSEHIAHLSEAKGDNRLWLAQVPREGGSLKNFDIEGIDPTTAQVILLRDGEAFVVVNTRGTFLVPVAGGEPQRMTGDLLTNLHRHPMDDRIVYEQRGGGIAIFDPNTQDVTSLTRRGVGVSPRWSPDGRFVVMVHDMEIQIIEVATRKRRTVGEGVRAYWTNMGLGLVILDETGTFTEGGQIPVADLKAQWVKLDTPGEAVTLMEKVHEVAADPTGRRFVFATHGEGIYKLDFEALPGEDKRRAERKAGLSSSAPKTQAQQGSPKLPKTRPRRPISSDTLKAIQ